MEAFETKEEFRDSALGNEINMTYDKVIVAFSGGKDSLACLLLLLYMGVDKRKIELWHHDIDGTMDHRAGEEQFFMDWPVTTDYCKAVSAAFGIPIYFSWKVGGFRREMLRDGNATAPTRWQNRDGSVSESGGKGKPGTRRRFPQVSADLSVRWCSAYLKIDVCASAIRGQDRFNDSKTLVVTGERAEESSARSKYKIIEPHRSDLRDGKSRRHVDQYRPVLRWKENEVWKIIGAFKVNPHPAYWLGWGRVSCMTCIFGSKDQWATASKVSPAQVKRVADYESEFGVTIQRGKSVPELVEMGEAYKEAGDERLVSMATSAIYNEQVILDEWELPPGAFGESSGPT